MSLFAISDLHLGFYNNKTMDIFGENWVNHHLKIKDNWLSMIKYSDTILIPGDVSWGKNIKEATPDLNFIDKLPGKKIIHSGNHDYW